MAVTWGPIQATSGTNGARVGLDITYSGSGSSRTVKWAIWLWTKRASFKSSANYTVSGAVSRNSTFNYSHSNNSRDWPTNNRTKINSGSFTQSLSFGSKTPVTLKGTVSGMGAIGGTARHTRTIHLPARPGNTPAAPTNVVAARSTDNRTRLTWSRSGTSQAPVLKQQVNRRFYLNGGWQTFATIANLPTSATSLLHDHGINLRVQFAVRTGNDAGWSAWTYSNEIDSRPGAPNAVTAEATESGNRVTWTNTSRIPAWTRVQRQEDGGAWVEATRRGSSWEEWTHASPDIAKTHRYRVRAEGQGTPALDSDWVYSNTIVLASAPNAPTNLGPPGLIDAETPSTFTWKFSPTDGSQQTAYQLRHRKSGTSPWTTTQIEYSSVSSYVLPADTYVNGDTLEWQVRAWGVHASASPWSTVYTVNTGSRPTASISFPTEGMIHESSTLIMEWGYDQSEGSRQRNWEAYLVDLSEGLDEGGTVVEERRGSGEATEVEFFTALGNDTEWRVDLRVRAANGLWSTTVGVEFQVSYSPPQNPITDLFWDRDRGAVHIQIENPPPSEEVQYQNLVPNPRGRDTSGTVTLRENLIRNRAQHPNAATLLGEIPGDGSIPGTTYSASVPAASWYIGTIAANNGAPLVTPGKTYTVSAWVLSPVDMYVVPRIPWRNAAGSNFQSLPGTNQFVPANVATQVSTTEVAPAEAFTGGIRLTGMPPYDYPAGTVIEYGGFLFEESDTALPFFDGDSTPDDTDLTAEWVGTPGESTSRIVAPKPVGIGSSAGGVAYYSAREDAYAIVKTAQTGTTYTTLSVPGATGVNVSVVTPVWSDLQEFAARTYMVGQSTAEVQIIGGSHVLRNSGLATQETLVPFNLQGSSSVPRGSTFYFRTAAVPGEYDGPWFDGDSEQDDERYSWAGTPHQSDSIRTIPATVDTIYNDVWRQIDGGEWVKVAGGVSPEVDLEETQYVARNVVLNPAGRNTEGRVAVNENLQLNPSFEDDINGWAPSGCVLTVANTFSKMWAKSEGGPGNARPEGDDWIANMVAHSGRNSFHIITNEQYVIPVDVGDWIGVSALLASDPGLRSFVTLQFVRSDFSIVSSRSTSKHEAEWYAGRKAVVAERVPAQTTGVRILLEGQKISGNFSGSERMWGNDVMVARSTTYSGALDKAQQYVDAGMRRQDVPPDFEYEWTGAPGLSTSVAWAPDPVGWQGAYYSKTEDALIALRDEIPLTEVEPQVGSTQVTWQPGPPVVNARKPFSGTDVRATGFSGPFRVAVVEGEWDGPYFDGDSDGFSDITGGPEAIIYYGHEWEGEPDDSPSAFFTYDPDLIIVTDPVPHLTLENCYRVTAWSAAPSAAESEPICITITPDTRTFCPQPEPGAPRVGEAFLNGGRNYSLVVQAVHDVTISEAGGKEDTILHRFSGRRFPIEFSGYGEETGVDLSFTTYPEPEYRGTVAATYDQWKELTYQPGPHMYRDWLGRRYLVSVGDLSGTREPGDLMACSVTMQRVGGVMP